MIKWQISNRCIYCFLTPGTLVNQLFPANWTACGMEKYFTYLELHKFWFQSQSSSFPIWSLIWRHFGWIPEQTWQSKIVFLVTTDRMVTRALSTVQYIVWLVVYSELNSQLAQLPGCNCWRKQKNQRRWCPVTRTDKSCTNDLFYSFLLYYI